MRMLNEAADNKDVLLREAECHFCACGVLQFGWRSQVISSYMKMSDKYTLSLLDQKQY